MTRFGRRLGLLALASVVVGVALTFATKGGDAHLLDEGDAFWYGSVAAALNDGHWFVDPFTGEPTAAHPPLTVLVLWLTSPLSTAVLAQRLTMTAVGALGVVAVGLLGREAAGERAGLIAAGLAVVVPSFWLNQTVVMSEALATVLYALALLLGIRLARRPGAAPAALLGLVVGLTVLTRAEAALLLPFLAAPVLLTARSLAWRSRLGLLALAGVVAAATIAPWSLTNLARFEEPVVVSTNDGVTLAGSNCDTTYHGEWLGSWSFDCVIAQAEPGVDESAISRELRSDGLRYARDNADRLPVVVAARVARPLGLWAPGQMVDDAVGEGRPPAASWAALVAFWAMLPVAAAGVVLLRRRRETLVPYAAALATVVVSAGLFNGYHRHRLPFDIAVCVLAAVALDALVRRRSSGPEPGAEPPDRVP